MKPVALVLLCLVRSHGSRRVKTPIRWLCLRTFAYFALSESRELRPGQVDQLCQAVDLGAYLNGCFDGKGGFKLSAYRPLRKGLPEAETRLYLRQLHDLEKGRPRRGEWPATLHYRQRVTEVSLNYLARLAGLRQRPVLLAICSLIQLLDDLLDHHQDLELGLPTLVADGAPAPAMLARDFWLALRVHKEPEERPVVACGWCVYVMVRLFVLCSRSWR